MKVIRNRTAELLLENRRLTAELDRIRNFQPTPGQINALPRKIREYIQRLRTTCDPLGDQAALICALESIDKLTEANVELRGELERMRSQPH